MNSVDAAGPDARAQPCTPRVHGTCAAPQKCAPVMVSEAPTTIEFRCVSAGLVGDGGNCETGPVGSQGFDDCARGFQCEFGQCKAECDPIDDSKPCSCGAPLAWSTDTLSAFSGNGICSRIDCDPFDSAACVAGKTCSPQKIPEDLELVPASQCYPVLGEPIGSSCGEAGQLPNVLCETGAVCVDNYVNGPQSCMQLCRPTDTYYDGTSMVGALRGDTSDGTAACPSDKECRYIQSLYRNTSTVPHLWGACLDPGGWGSCEGFDLLGLLAAIEVGTKSTFCATGKCPRGCVSSAFDLL